ncbi:MAG: bifunctional demethylmenaquinone methyltransferase/2-methoxy-6-polyprenyl-1,4-benzoquinol methylase UbiE [Bacteroidales bacterium]|nr:bifunctional demethylmenaquinone methyltransferase/2-methoxy-6-polyprenyl-1,4-benzoquinol methylase UbiE [Bacteroidales bacterium]
MKEKEKIKAMFDSIARRYDMLNHLLSLGLDKGWRRRLVGFLAAGSQRRILDLATGTGDLAIKLVDLNPDEIVASDISENMLDIARKKVKAYGLENKIKIMQADAERLPFADNSFDAVTIAFGIRNVENLAASLSEIIRVLDNNGMVAILEFSKPKNIITGSLFYLYFRFILPLIGGLISGSYKAYKYLPLSVAAFPDGELFLALLKEAGFKNVRQRRMTGGIVSLYTAEK